MKLLIIGNGFDLDLGLNTTYSNFYNHSCFSTKSEDELVPGCLEAFLKEMNKNEIRWAELEESMATYVKSKKGKISDTIIAIDKQFLKNLKEEFSEFILNNYYNKTFGSDISPFNDSLAKRIIDNNKTRPFDAIYSFNCIQYCDLVIFTDNQIDSLSGVNNIHGIYNAFIFGIRKEDCTREEYLFLAKEKQDNYPFEVADNLRKDLLLADNVVFFGHSLNRIDMCYFQDFFQKCLKDHRLTREITIITKDSNAVGNIKDNISRHALPFKKLESSCNISFVMTEDYNNKVNMEKVERMFERFSTDNIDYKDL